MVDAAAKLTGRVERVLEGIANRPEKKYLVLNKVDLTRKDKLLTIATEINARVAFDETFFIAASNGDGVPELKAHLAALMPEGPWHFPEDALDAPRQLRGSVDHDEDRLGLLEAAPGGGDHRAIEPAGRREDARRVDQDDLRLARHRDSHQPGARRLRLGADDRDLLADERVDEGRFARIGGADDGDEAAPLGHVRSSSASRASSAAAATFSAACFDAPSPSASASLPILTATRKRGAWSGPSRRPRRYSGGRRLRAKAHYGSAAFGCLGAASCPSLMSPTLRVMKARAASSPPANHSAPDTTTEREVGQE